MYYAASIALLGLMALCSDQQPVEEKPNRNMFGHNIPRGLTITSDSLSQGYVMFSVSNSGATYLINRKGEVVHQWKGTYSSFNPYIMDDGSIMVGEQDPDYPVFGFGGPYGRIQKISWDGNILWDFEYADTIQILHHDFAIKPNGNILAIAYETMSYDDAIAMGRAAHLSPQSGPWLEKIIEIAPEGLQGGKIVWEWHLKDHLIQDLDANKPNYGILSAHPELISFNIGDSVPAPITQDSLDILKTQGLSETDRNLTRFNAGSDIFHFNALDYNPARQEIAISSPALSEVFILDQSTTTEEAGTHLGGKSGKGGDLIYRWGNPENYLHGDSTNRRLYHQHDVRWVEAGKPGAGNLTIFNNGVPNGPDSLEYSSVYELKPPVGEGSNYVLMADGKYGPEELEWNYVAGDTVSFYSSFISGAHRMENGNTFINEGAKARFFEVTPKNEIVWEYLSPYRGEIRKPNGDPTDLMPMTFSTFRSTFIPADHPALQGRELKPLDPQPVVYKMPPPPEKKEE